PWRYSGRHGTPPAQTGPTTGGMPPGQAGTAGPFGTAGTPGPGQGTVGAGIGTLAVDLTVSGTSISTGPPAAAEAAPIWSGSRSITAISSLSNRTFSPSISSAFSAPEALSAVLAGAATPALSCSALSP